MRHQPSTMHAVQVSAHGGPETLLYRTDLDVPSPGKAEVLIKVGAAGINNTDINTRIGWYSKGNSDPQDASWGGEALQLPRIQGADICGTVVTVGEGTPTSLIGQRVLVEPCLREVLGEPLRSPLGISDLSVTAGLPTT